MFLGDLDTAYKNGLGLDSGSSLQKDKDLELENRNLNHILKKERERKNQKNWKSASHYILKQLFLAELAFSLGERKLFNPLLFILC